MLAYENMRAQEARNKIAFSKSQNQYDGVVSTAPDMQKFSVKHLLQLLNYSRNHDIIF